MNLLNPLFYKRNEPTFTKIVTCSKHGVVPSFNVHIAGGKEYDVCWDCLGEFGSKHCTVQLGETK